MRILALLMILAASCHAVSRAADESFTAERAKALIPEAAGAPADEFRKLGEAAVPTTLRLSNGDSLTWLVLMYTPGPDTPENPTSFRWLFGNNTPNPATIAAAIMGPKDKSGKARPYVTLIHPEYITDCTCNVDGETSTGTVAFRAKKVYEGTAEYTARKKNGKWRIEAFRLPDLKITTVLGADGKWVKK